MQLKSLKRQIRGQEVSLDQSVAADIPKQKTLICAWRSRSHEEDR